MESENLERKVLLPVTIRNRISDSDIYFLDLPMENDFLDNKLESFGLAGSDSDKCILDRIQFSAMESLEGTQVNVHALNYLAKRLYHFSYEEIKKFNILLCSKKFSSVEEIIDMSYNLQMVELNALYAKDVIHNNIKVSGLAAVIEELYQADQGEEFFIPWMAEVCIARNDGTKIIIEAPIRTEGYLFLENNYNVRNFTIENIDNSEEYILPIGRIKGDIDLKKLNEMILKISEPDFNIRKWRTYTDEYEFKTLDELFYLCTHLNDFIFDDSILSYEDYGTEILFSLFDYGRDDFNGVANMFDVIKIGKKMCEIAQTTCTQNGLITSKEAIMKGVKAMQDFPTQKKVERIRELYPSGTRIRLVSMDDFQAIESGMSGTVDMVDDGGQIQMKWDNGRGLALIPGEDIFEVISRPEEKQEEGMKLL